MKKSNRKGFISISVVYAFLILFLLLLLAIVESYSSRQNMLNKIVEETKDELEGQITDLTQESVTFTYKGAYERYKVPRTGYYKIELWGAQGGSSTSVGGSFIGGKGGYTSGNILLNKDEVIYVYVGQGGSSSSTYAATNSATFNGGGATTGGISASVIASSGGGATDIRFGGNSLNNRIMVAAGGGGGLYWTGDSCNRNGGSGGGLSGHGGSVCRTTTCAATPVSGITNATGGTQTSGGVATNNYSTSPLGGTFGVGGSSHNSASGGGGGYYGGGAGKDYGCTPSSGAGGSSFISGYAGVDALNSGGSHSHNTKHFSNKYFIDGKMQIGVNSGNGKAKITYLGVNEPTRTNTKLSEVQYIKDCTNGSTADIWNAWVQIQAIEEGQNVAYGKTVEMTSPALTNNSWWVNESRIVNGIVGDGGTHTVNNDFQCVIVNLGDTHNLDEIAVWHYFGDGRTFYSNTTYVSSDKETWIPIKATEESEPSTGKRVTAWDVNDDVTPYYGFSIRNPKGGSLLIQNITTGVSITVPSNTTKYFNANIGDTIKVTATPAANFTNVYLKNGNTNMSSGGSFVFDGNTPSTVSSSWKRNDYILFNLDEINNVPFSATLCDGYCSSTYASEQSSSRHYYHYYTTQTAMRLDAVSTSAIDLTDFKQVCSWAYTATNTSYVTSGAYQLGILSDRTSWVHEHAVASTTAMPMINPPAGLCGNIQSYNGSYYVGIQLLQFTSSAVGVTTYVHYVYLAGDTYN